MKVNFIIKEIFKYFELLQSFFYALNDIGVKMRL